MAPAAIDTFAGVTAIDCSVAAVMVRPVEPEIEPEVAAMVVVPATNPLANPLLEIEAVAVLLELQVTEAVMFCVLPLL